MPRASQDDEDGAVQKCVGDDGERQRAGAEASESCFCRGHDEPWPFQPSSPVRVRARFQLTA
jgi:hypothetical protein